MSTIQEPHDDDIRGDEYKDDWKRKFKKEIKVNQELGRRLREMKQKLHEEKVQSQQLATQFQDYKAQHQCESCSKIVNGCVNCKILEEEIERLKRIIAMHSIPSNQGQSTLLISHEMDKVNEDQRLDQSSRSPLRMRSSVIIVREESGNIHAVNEVPPVHPSSHSLSSSDPHEQVSIASDNLSSILRHKSTKLELTNLPRAQMQLRKTSLRRPHHTDHDNNQTQHETILHSFIEYEDKSLGDLFKYAVVLAGPSPRKPKRTVLSSFSNRLKVADFRRTRSLPESTQLPSDAEIIPEQASNLIKQSGSNVRPSSSGGHSWLMRRQTQTLQDFIDDQPAPSPQKKTGWLANFVSQGFRNTTTAPSPVKTSCTISEAPARLLSAPQRDEYGGSCDPNSSNTRPASKMLCVYPPTYTEVHELEGLLEICFPYEDLMPVASDFSLARLKRTLQERHRTYRDADSTFVLTIASASNPTEITYAICVRCPLFSDDMKNDSAEIVPERAGNGGSSGASLPAQCCLCLLSPYPFFSLFFKVLYGIAVLWEEKQKSNRDKIAQFAKEELEGPLPAPLSMKDFTDHFTSIMERLKQMRVPSMGGWSRMMLSPDVTHLAFHRPHSESVSMERRTLLLEYAAPTLFALLSVDQVLFLLGCLCCERKILLVSDHVNVVSSCVLALITLLDPLQWAGPVVTILPPRLDELLEAPVPLIAGRVSIKSAKIPNFSTLSKPMNGVIEMNMDQNNLCMHEEDLMKYHELKLPGCDGLAHELKYFSDQLFEKHLEPDFPTVEQTEACEIICTRLHRHIESLCLFAMGEISDLELSSSGLLSPRARSNVGGAQRVSDSSITTVSSTSDLVDDYVRRFQETQMFSMFSLQRQELRKSLEEDEMENGYEDDHEAGDDCTSFDLAADACHPETKFSDIAINYELETVRVEANHA